MCIDDGTGPLKSNLPQKSPEICCNTSADASAFALHQRGRASGNFTVSSALMHDDAKTHIFCLLNEAFKAACSLYCKEILRAKLHKRTR